MSRGGASGGSRGGGGGGMRTGMATFWRCNKAGAIPHFTQHLKTNPGDFNCWLFRGISYSIIGQNQNAVSDLQQAARVGNECEKLVANSFLQTNPADSFRMLKEATQKYPTDGTGWFWLAGSGNTPQAERIAARQKCIDLNYKYAHECHFHLGRMLASQGKHHEAIQRFQTSLGGNPDRTVCHIQLGFSLLKTGQIDKAKQHFEKATTLNPVLTDANLGLSKVYEQQGNHQEAHKHLRIWQASQDTRGQSTASGPPSSNPTPMQIPTSTAGGTTVLGRAQQSVIPVQTSVDQLGASLSEGLQMETRSDYMSVAKGPPHGKTTILGRYSASHGGPLNTYEKDLEHFNNFSSAGYLRTTPKNEMILYRWGGSEAGQYWTAEPHEGNEAFRQDAAIAPEWNDFTQSFSIVVPNGIELIEGLCAPQTVVTRGMITNSLLGRGCWQIFIPREVVKHLLSANKCKEKGDSKGWDEGIKKALKEQEKLRDKFVTELGEPPKVQWKQERKWF